MRCRVWEYGRVEWLSRSLCSFTTAEAKHKESEQRSPEMPAQRVLRADSTERINRRPEAKVHNDNLTPFPSPGRSRLHVDLPLLNRTARCPVPKTSLRFPSTRNTLTHKRSVMPGHVG